ncbi:MAG TPA: hypothetical protein VN603_04450 [Candidatus Acidoferrales bacterium]|nr:hypothetical protein [Candidatus Acidoferrales bacterium]
MTDRPPDFALLRAVEILEKIAKERSQPIAPPPNVEHQIVLACERCTFAVGKTRRREVERVLGRGQSYPAKGFHTYAVAPPETQPDGAPSRWLLSLFYRGDLLFGVEHYIPKIQGAPPMPLSTPGVVRVEPGGFRLGGAMNDLGYFVPAHGGPSPVVFALSFEARFDGGVVWIMGNGGHIERLAIYGAEHP